jgi:hypothetical protein
VCAGELVALLTLTNVLNYLNVQKVDIPKVCAVRLLTDICVGDSLQLTEKFGLAKVKEMLKDIVNSCYDSAIEKQKAEGYIVLERGLATIPLAGPMLALMSPSTPTTFGLVSCPSGDVSELLLAPV